MSVEDMVRGVMRFIGDCEGEDEELDYSGYDDEVGFWLDVSCWGKRKEGLEMRVVLWNIERSCVLSFMRKMV